MPKNPAFTSARGRAKAEPISYEEEGDDDFDEEEQQEQQKTKKGRGKRRNRDEEDDDAASEFHPRSIEDIQFGAWYEKAPTLPPLTEREVKLENRKQERLRKKKARKGKLTEDELKTATSMQIAQLATKLAQAKAAYEERAAEHFKAKPKKGNNKWLSTVLKSGTGADKMAAMTMLIQEDPFFSLRNLETLLALAKKKGRRENSMACETIKDLFVTNLLPDRKLKYFKDQPLDHPAVTIDHLVHWYFEHELKLKYAEYVQILEVNSKDTVASQRQQMIKHIYDLLNAKPEQERTLLSLIINKFGDLEKKISSSVVYQLTNLLQKHPGMKMAVVKEVQPLLYRANVSLRAQYCAVIFLNQIVLSSREGELASMLLSIYFSLFKRLLDAKDVNTKMLSALLSGISRAFPFAPTNDVKYEEHINSLFRMVHVTTFNKSVQALLVLLQLLFSQAQADGKGETAKMDAEQKEAHKQRMESVAKRFYRALYSKMLSVELFNSSKQPLFLNILFKSIKLDTCTPRVKAFVKRLLQVSIYQKPSFICGALLMLSELIKMNPRLKSMIKENHEVTKTSLAGDEQEEQEEKAAGSEEVETSKDEGNKSKNEDEGDDMLGGGDEVEEESGSSNTSENKEKEPEAETKQDGAWQAFYDPLKREPEYANADKSCTWELVELQKHFHPSVSKWSGMLLEGTPIFYQGNPLQDFTLTAFLDRFSFRNPKQKEREKGGSLMQPLSVPHWVNKEPVNRPQFLQHQERVRDEEQFFYKFFSQKKMLAKFSGEEETTDKKKKSKDDLEFAGETDKETGEYDYNDMALSEDEEEVREDLPLDNEENDEFYEHLLMQELEAEENGDFAEDDAEASGDFASLDEFAHILDGAGGEEVSAKQKEWEARTKKNKKGAKGKKKAASDEDEGDIFDMDDSASGEEEDEGDFNFASKDGDYYEDETMTSTSKKRKRPFNIGGGGRGGRSAKMARGGGTSRGGRGGARGRAGSSRGGSRGRRGGSRGGRGRK